MYNCLVDPRILQIHLMIRWLWLLRNFVVIWNNFRRQMPVHIIYCYVQKNWNVALRLMTTYMHHFKFGTGFRWIYFVLYQNKTLFLKDNPSLFKGCLISYTSLAELQWFLSICNIFPRMHFELLTRKYITFGVLVLSHHIHCCFYEIWDIWRHSRVEELQCLYLACLSKCFLVQQPIQWRLYNFFKTW